MENVNVNGYEFINEFGGTRNGFYHKTILKDKNGNEIADYKVNYCNRTWESYTFQSVMKNCVYTLIENKFVDFLRLAKEKYGIKRLSKTKKEQARKVFEGLTEIKELQKVYCEL